MELRDYQKRIAEQGTEIINEHGFVYLAMEVRTGKSLTALEIANRIGSNSVLFLTKKKAISSIEGDYKSFGYDFDLLVYNYESFHKINMSEFGTIILDEVHSTGAFPKPSKRAKQVHDYIAVFKPKVILLSGTPTPESYSQMYHQVYGIPMNPFRRYKNFYRFCDDYVNVKQKMINGRLINDYSKGKEEIIKAMEPYTITYTQSQAGFESTIKETVLHVDLEPGVYKLCDRLKRDLVVEGKEETILADTPVKLMQKLHQMYSGTIKFESGNRMVIDYTKADFIKEHFKGSRIGIFYKFIAELDAIKESFGDQVCTDLETFDNTDCQAIALQIVSGREGISLRNADYIVYYNIDFSATSYWQSRDRATTKNRKKNEVFWIFSNGGIEDKIYKAVSRKKSYTLYHFKKDYG